jgi:hypothetical protein
MENSDIRGCNSGRFPREVGDAEYQLTVARALIAKPENWQKDGFSNKTRDAFCAAGALREPWLALSVKEGYYGASKAAQILGSVVGIKNWSEICDWNDASERTHADVLGAYDAAIAEARRRGV